MVNYIIGVDLGGTKIATAVIDIKGKILSKKKEFTVVDFGPEAVIKQMLRMVNQVLDLAKIKLKQVKGIGIGAAGPLNTKKGIIIAPPNLPGWHNVQLIEPFKKEFNLPVFLDNDANAACLGEWYFGAGCGTKNMVYLTVSTGIGGGIIIDGKLYHGTNDNAGEIGHMTINPNGPLCNCGNYGCLEAHASGTAVARFAKDALKEKMKETLVLKLVDNDIEKVTAKIIFQAAKKRDKFSKGIIEMTSEFLGIGVANVINIFNPEKVVLGGGVTKAGSLLFKKVRETAYKRAMPAVSKVTKIVPAKLGDNVGIMGAATLVLVCSKKS